MDSIVSYVDSTTSKIIKTCYLSEALSAIRNGAQQERVIKMRALVDSQHDQYNILKGQLPAHIFSGIFAGGHGIQNLVKYNKILCLDIDKLNSNDFLRVKTHLINDPYVFAFWVSPSGKGFKGLVKLDYGDILLNDCTYWHKEAYLQVSEYFRTQYDIELDPHCKDVPRLCFVSYDPELFEKHSTPFPVKPIKEVPLVNDVAKSEKRQKKTWHYRGDKYYLTLPGRNQSKDRDRMGSILRYLEKRHLSITSSYSEWFNVAMAIVSTFNYDIGEQYFLRLCRIDGDKHDEDASILLLRYCYVHSNYDITFKTIIYFAQKKGYHINQRAVPIVGEEP